MASSTGELSSRKPPSSTSENSVDLYLSKLLDDWEEKKRSDVAADIVFHAVTANNPKLAIEQAEYLLRSKDKRPDELIKLSQSILEGNTQPALVQHNTTHSFVDPELAIRAKIGFYKRRLIEWPRNAIFWTEKSRLYAAIGELDKAKSATRIAINLAGTNRYVLRCAIRFFLHIKDLDEIYTLFSKHPNLYKDHWILAPYIALQDKLKKTNLKIKAVRSLIDKLDDREITELTGSLASLELENGALKASKKLFLKSAQMPNDNSLAQLTWAKQETGIELSTTNQNIPFIYEANSRAALSKGDFPAALESTIDWIMDEPFSIVPATTGSYIAASFTDDLKCAEQFCTLGLRANPNDSTLINNYAVILAKKGRVDLALEQFMKINTAEESSSMSITLNATAGLLLFRSGNPQEGREKYQEAINLAKKLNQPEAQSMAELHYAQEEIELGELKPENIKKLISNNTTNKKTPEIDFLVTKVSNQLHKNNLITKY